MKELVNRLRFNKHPLRKNNDIVAAMYAMYLRGPDAKPCSLAQIARYYHKTRQAIYDVFRSRGYNLRSKRLSGLTVVDGFRFTLFKGGYLRGTVRGRRQLLHHYIWEKERGKVPRGFVLHHKDNDPANNVIGNLELVPKRETPKRFNPEHRNQYSTPDDHKKCPQCGAPRPEACKLPCPECGFKDC